MHDLIILAGAPGSGKSTLGYGLKGALDGVYIDYGHLRKFHMDPEWNKKGDAEEALTFENLLFIVQNYLSRGWKPVIVSDTPFYRTPELAAAFPESKVCVVTLMTSDEELARRIAERTEGWKDLGRILEWNKAVRESTPLPNEVRIETTGFPREETLARTLQYLRQAGFPPADD